MNALRLCLLLALPAFAQLAKEPPITAIELTLQAVGPPLPSFRHELLPSSASLEKNNAALMNHRAMHAMAEARWPAKEEQAFREKFDLAYKGPMAAFPKELAQAYLKPYTATFRELEAAAKCDHCDWGLDQRVLNELLPEAQKIRELASLLKLRCRLHQAEGKFELALRDIRTGLVLGRHAAEAPTILHFFVGNALASIFLGELEQTLQTPGCPNLYWSLTALPRPLVDLRKSLEGEQRATEAALALPKDLDRGPMTPEAARAALDRLWESMVSRTDEERPTIGEGRLGLALFITLQHPRARKTLLDGGKTEAELDAMPAAQVVLLDALVRFRNTRDEHFVWYHAPYAEAIAGMRKSRDLERARRVETPFDLLGWHFDILMPSMDKVFSSVVRTDRRVASVRVLEAVRLHAAKHDGALPETLAAITVVPVPVDPATGKEFVYAARGTSFTLEAIKPPGSEDDRNQRWKYAVTIIK